MHSLTACSRGFRGRCGGEVLCSLQSNTSWQPDVQRSPTEMGQVVGSGALAQEMVPELRCAVSGVMLKRLVPSELAQTELGKQNCSCSYHGGPVLEGVISQQHQLSQIAAQKVQPAQRAPLSMPAAWAFRANGCLDTSVRVHIHMSRLRAAQIRTCMCMQRGTPQAASLAYSKSFGHRNQLTAHQLFPWALRGLQL